MKPGLHSHLVTSIDSIRGRSPAGEIVAYFLLLALVPLLPIPYGAVLPAGAARLEASAFLVAALAIFFARPGYGLRAARLPFVLLLCLTALAIFQLIPLPRQALALLSPESATVYRQANEVLRLHAATPATPRISIAPSETVGLLLLILSFAALGVSAALLLANRARRVLFAYVFIGSCLVHIAIAAAKGEQRIHGAFVNPNHFAGYLELALFTGFGLLWGEVLTNRDRAEGVRDKAEAAEKRLAPLALPVLAVGGVAAGIGLTRSRGGIAAAAIALVVVLAAGIVRQARRRSGKMLFTAIFAAIAVIWFAYGTAKHDFILRFLASDPREVGSDTRVQLWRTSIEAWKHYPLFGSGLGSFREGFRPVQPESVQGLVEQAHNDFLQMLVTGGAIGAVLVVMLFGSIARSLVTLWRSQPHRREGAMVLGVSGAMLALVLHGIVEFNFSIPAIPATFAVLSGLAFAAGSDQEVQRSFTRRSRQAKEPPARVAALSE